MKDPARSLRNLGLARLTLLLPLVAVGCGDDSSQDETSATTTATTATTDPETTGGGDTTGGWGTTTSGATSGTTSDFDACAPEGLPPCDVVRCVQSWDFTCDECGSKVEPERCFEIFAGCAYPKLDCELPSPCGRVWGYGAEDPAVLDTLDDEDAATCLLKSLRNGESARYEIAWGDMSDGKGERSASSVLDELDADDLFSARIDLCGKGPA